MQTPKLRLLILPLLLVAAAGCSLVSNGKRPEPAPAEPQEEASPAAARPMPWEVWPRFKSLSGQPLLNREILYGDELRESGRNNTALDAYLKASRMSLSPEEAEAAALRVAGQYLILNKPTKALSVVGSFYRKRGEDESKVSPEFGLLLAYGFGGEGDTSQSLAWFGRVNSQSLAQGGGSAPARQGTMLLLRSLQTDELEKAATKWHADEFINGLIGQERALRAAPGWVEPAKQAGVPFWASYDPSLSVAPERSSAPVTDDQVKVGAILSLAAKYGPVGPDMKRGIELAAAAQAQLPKVSLEVRDVSADAADSSAVVRQLASGQQVSVIIGPLGSAAANTAREIGVPLLSLSKTEPFGVGGGVFRLGMTPSSQVEALVNTAYGELKLTKFAIVHPQTPAGTEFLEAFRSRLGELNLPLVLEVGYSTGDEVSMLEAAQRLEASGAEAVLVPDSVEVSSRLLTGLSPEFRKGVRVLGTSAWDSVDKIARSQALFSRAIFVAPFFKNSTRPEVQDFISSYRAKFNAAPSVHSAQGFDAQTVVNAALVVAREKRLPVQDALQRLPQYNGVTGVILPGSTGELHRILYVVEVGATMFQEKLPPQQVQRYDEVIAMRGNEPVAADGESAPLEADQKVSSGY